MSPPARFSNVPFDKLFPHFIGRQDELAAIKAALSVIAGDKPTRYVIYGSQGVGKSQLMIQFAKTCYEEYRYPYIFWISATSVDKITREYEQIYDSLIHTESIRFNQFDKLTAARRWLEQCDADWLLIFDNVEHTTLEFVKRYLPQSNKSGHGRIVFTTIAKSLAEVLAPVSEMQNRTFELETPNVKNAGEMLLKQFEGDVMSVDKVESLVTEIGCLPLAITHAATFMMETGKSLDHTLELYKNHKYSVR